MNAEWRLLNELVATLESLEVYSKSESVRKSANKRKIELMQNALDILNGKQEDEMCGPKQEKKEKWEYNQRYGLVKVK